MRKRKIGGKVSIVAGVGMIAFAVGSLQAAEADFDYDIPSQSLASALRSFARTSHAQIIFDDALVHDVRTNTIHGRYSTDIVLTKLLATSGLTARHDSSGVYVIAMTSAQDSQAASGQPSPTGDDPPPDAPPTQVTVKAKRPELTDKVDRRVYNLANDASAGVGMATDLLDKIPSVQVSPTGVVTLRGDRRVTILIDGKEPANGNQALLSLAAADIDRIEVITNPSARYGPDGSAGIINIITKKKFPLGFSGSISPQIAGNGERMISGLFDLNYGKLSAKGVVNFDHLPLLRRMRVTYDTPAAAASANTMKAIGDRSWLDLTLNYKVDERNSLALDIASSKGGTTQNDAFSYTSGGANYTGVSHSNHPFHMTYVDATYTRSIDAAGTTLSVDASGARTNSSFNESTVNQYTSGDEATFGQSTSTLVVENDLTVDFGRTFSEEMSFNAGVELKPQHTTTNSLFYDTGNIGGPYTDGLAHNFDGTRTVSAAYMTWSQGFGAWTGLLGMRTEREDLSLVTADNVVKREDMNLYPSLHLMRSVGQNSKLKLSYAKRIDRPDIAQYDPSIGSANSEIYYTGNPDLKSPKTDSFEAQYIYNLKDTNFEGTLFSRHTQDYTWSESTLDSSGAIHVRPANAGDATSSGISTTLRAPVTPHLKYSLNIDLLHNTIPQYDSGTRTFNSLNSNILVEYEAPARSKLKGDVYQLKLNYTGRAYNPEGYSGAYHSLDLTWQHSLTPKVVAVIDAINITNGSDMVQIVDIPGLKYRSAQRMFGTYLRFGLAYKFAVN
ncbi:TonB-dependent receptor domain-containing protein [Asticcacaulis benevestitus]|uniref:Secretin/TonB short N-terminal domain-containing protein n=1 Tax=Asticcacaulis benevestitus DSM 16100 = ATCC BAA-896 TaxID=1121022 RepID=V4PP44_9CAUL|nr:TonB-dependent receptor [Asticcacaulis benevestitus]ESQ87260.1 hypothetical protein ABENE_17305 [Asticcacaulis benevestitus DSM 16100 = ATCC BAA-896]